MNEIEEWVKNCICNNDMHAFYTSPAWRHLQAQVLKRDHYECQRCKAKGLVSQARTVHHIQYVKKRPDLALDPSNLESICESCHWEEHHKREERFLNVERW